MELKKVNFDNYTVQYESSAEEGVAYLRDRLDYNETKVFFDQAFSKGTVEFEDSYGNNYSLTKNSDGTYMVTKK